MTVLTPRQLVARKFDQTHMSPARVRRAIEQMADEQWVCGYRPTPDDYQREMVFVSRNNPWAAVFDRTLNGDVELPRGAIESRTAKVLQDPGSGRQLAALGIAIVGRGVNTVMVRATSPDLARLVNRCRYAPATTTCQTARLIEVVLGLYRRPRRLSDVARLRTAYLLEDMGLYCDDILSNRQRCRVHSRWSYRPCFTTPTNPEVPF